VLNDYHPYSTIEKLVGGFKVPWLSDKIEALRIASYALYEQIYWTIPEGFKVMQRGKDTEPLYLPSGRVIVETMNQYMAGGLQVVPDPKIGTASDQQQAALLWDMFQKREAVYSKFASNKRYGIMRGDWVFILRGDPTRPAGSRVSFDVVDPASVFKIYATDENGVEDFDVVVGYHIVEQAQYPQLSKDKFFIKRTTFRKEQGGPGPVTYSVEVFEMDEWGGPGQGEEGKIQLTLVPETVLPAPIDSPPVYHIRHFDEPNNPWGSSEMRGIESLMGHLNQSGSDEELELVLTGLGCYATNAGSPVEEDGITPRPWDMGPGKVVELPQGPGYFFNRVTGNTTVEPFQSHIDMLTNWLDQATATPPAAKGRVEVAAAESGIAMLIELGPLLARVGEKEQIVTDVSNHMWYDWGKWLTAYEGSAFAGPLAPVDDPTKLKAQLINTYGPKLPKNDSKRLTELTALFTAKAIPLSVIWDEMRAGDYPDLPDNVTLLAALEEQTQMNAEAEAAALASRIDGELADTEDLANQD
jgi:hypothetical protein